MATKSASQNDHRRRLRAEATESWLIFAVSFPVCLAAAALKRVVRRPSHADTHLPFERPSIFAEAKAAASTCSSFAFMG